jgi:hypothetical protein
MISFAKPGLTEDFYTVHKEEFSAISYICGKHTWQRRSIFTGDKLIFSSERMLHKDYDRKASVAKKISGRDPEGAWRQDELIGGKSPVVK